MKMFAIPGLLLAAALTTSLPAAAAQPKMEAALATLEQAKATLMEASEDKGGHRAKAIQAVEVAMNQVRKGIEYDKAHTKPSEKMK